MNRSDILKFNCRSPRCLARLSRQTHSKMSSSVDIIAVSRAECLDESSCGSRPAAPLPPVPSHIATHASTMASGVSAIQISHPSLRPELSAPVEVATTGTRWAAASRSLMREPPPRARAPGQCWRARRSARGRRPRRARRAERDAPAPSAVAADCARPASSTQARPERAISGGRSASSSHSAASRLGKYPNPPTKRSAHPGAGRIGAGGSATAFGTTIGRTPSVSRRYRRRRSASVETKATSAFGSQSDDQPVESRRLGLEPPAGDPIAAQHVKRRDPPMRLRRRPRRDRPISAASVSRGHAPMTGSR